MGFLHAEQTRRDSECTPEMGPFPIQLVREQSSIKCVAAAYQSSSSFSNTTFHLSLLQSVLLLEPRRIICPQNTKISHLLLMLLPFLPQINPHLELLDFCNLNLSFYLVSQSYYTLEVLDQCATVSYSCHRVIVSIACISKPCYPLYTSRS